MKHNRRQIFNYLQIRDTNNDFKQQEESIPTVRIPPACQRYMFRPPDVSTDGKGVFSSEQV